MDDPPQPTNRQIKALRQIKKNEAGAQVVINSDDAEECVDNRWAET